MSWAQVLKAFNIWGKQKLKSKLKGDAVYEVRRKAIPGHAN